MVDLIYPLKIYLKTINCSFCIPIVGYLYPTKAYHLKSRQIRESDLLKLGIGCRVCAVRTHAVVEPQNPSKVV